MIRWLALAGIIMLGAWVVWPRASLEINDKALAPLEVPGPVTIAVLGTSLSANGTWPAALEDALDGCTARDVTVRNMAKAGANSDWGVTQIEAVIGAEPDLVLLEFAVNDADIFDGLWLRASLANHDRLLTAFTDAGIPVLLMSMSHAHGPPGMIRPRLGGYYASYDDLAARYDSGLIDFYARWRGLPKPQQRFEDGLHPGQDVQTSVMLAPLRAMIGAALGASDC